MLCYVSTVAGVRVAAAGTTNDDRNKWRRGVRKTEVKTGNTNVYERSRDTGAARRSQGELNYSPKSYVVLLKRLFISIIH